MPPAPAYPADRPVIGGSARRRGRHRGATPDRRPRHRRASRTLHRHLHTRAHSGPARHLHTLALRCAAATGDRAGELAALRGLGQVHQLQGRHELASDYYRQSLHIARTIGDRSGQLEAIHGLARAHHDLGEPELAGQHWKRALEILTDIGVSQVAEISVDGIRAVLAGLDQHRAESTTAQPDSG